MTAEQISERSVEPQSPWEAAIAEFTSLKTQPYDAAALEEAFARANSALGDDINLARSGDRFSMGYDLASQAANFAEANQDVDSAKAYRLIAGAYHELQHEYQ